MSSQIFNGKVAKYVVSELIGSGGEGKVFNLSSHESLVLKIYNEPLSTEKIKKLLFMTTIINMQLQSFAAWPSDVVYDSNNIVCGFVMKKLTKYVPLHMLFSPMDRKKSFLIKALTF